MYIQKFAEFNDHELILEVIVIAQKSREFVTSYSHVDLRAVGQYA